MQCIPRNTAVAASRRIYITLVDATDLVTPEDIDPTGDAPVMFANGAAIVGTEADLIKVDGATGHYYWEATQAQTNYAPGTILRGSIQPAGCALTILEAEIGPLASESEEVTVSATSITAIQAGLATSAALATLATAVGVIDDLLDTELPALTAAVAALATAVGVVDDLLDTEMPAVTASLSALTTAVAAIKTKTDSLAFTVAGRVDANTRSMNSTPVLGVGTALDKWRG